MNPVDENTYAFMTDFLQEIVDTVSKDKYVHLGMDEVSHSPCHVRRIAYKIYF